MGSNMNSKRTVIHSYIAVKLCWLVLSVAERRYENTRQHNNYHRNIQALKLVTWFFVSLFLKTTTRENCFLLATLIFRKKRISNEGRRRWHRPLAFAFVSRPVPFP
jgi:hypothetical protein